jgi:DNA-binding beta-propeller fold protein YncE
MNIKKIKILTLAILTGWVVFAFGETVPHLKFQAIIGDMRGKGMQNLSVACNKNGSIYLLTLNDWIEKFNSNGKYEKSIRIKLGWPHTYYYYLAAFGKVILLGNYKKDYPWVFSISRTGNSIGKFNNPTMVATDKKGNLYVCDNGNNRIQIFSPENTNLPKSIIPIGVSPVFVCVKNGFMAVLTANGNLLLYKKENNSFILISSMVIGTGAVSACFGSQKSIYVAFRGGPDFFQMTKYIFQNGKIVLSKIIAPSYMDQWPNFFPAGVPMVNSPDGQIWFGTDLYSSVLSLNPLTDKIKQRFTTGWRQDIALGFDSENKIYVAGYPDSKGNIRINIYKMEPNGNIIKTGTFHSKTQKPLYHNDGVPVWGLLPRPDGKSIYIRVVNPQQGWPAFTIYKVEQNGAIKPFYDFGQAYAKRITFGPSEAVYSLQFYNKNSILLASIPTVSVIRLSLDGKVLWEAGHWHSAGASNINFGAPVETAIDSKGNIWVVDSEKNKVFCLSPQGKLLMSYGGLHGIDDTKGKGFYHPTGIAIARVNGKDYLFVGDAGNLRIVKYQIVY